MAKIYSDRVKGWIDIKNIIGYLKKNKQVLDSVL